MTLVEIVIWSSSLAKTVIGKGECLKCVATTTVVKSQRSIASLRVTLWICKTKIKATALSQMSIVWTTQSCFFWQGLALTARNLESFLQCRHCKDFVFDRYYSPYLSWLLHCRFLRLQLVAFLDMMPQSCSCPSIMLMTRPSTCGTHL